MHLAPRFLLCVLQKGVEGARSAGHLTVMVGTSGTSCCLLLSMLEYTPPGGHSVAELSSVGLAQPSGQGQRVPAAHLSCGPGAWSGRGE